MIIHSINLVAPGNKGVNSKPNLVEYLPVIIEALDWAHIALAAYPFLKVTPSNAILSMLGVIKEPSPAPPL